MLDVFASVGVQFFDITHTNLDGEKRGFRPKQSLSTTRTSMPHLIQSAPRRQNNVIIRPHQPRPTLLIQLDDLNEAALERLRDVFFPGSPSKAGQGTRTPTLPAGFAKEQGPTQAHQEPPRQRETGRAGKWPSYQYCLDHAPKAHGGDHADTSRADFTWCMTALDWGFSIEAVASRLMEESAKARENGQPYALLTATNAAAAVMRRHNTADLSL